MVYVVVVVVVGQHPDVVVVDEQQMLVDVLLEQQKDACRQLVEYRGLTKRNLNSFVVTAVDVRGSGPKLDCNLRAGYRWLGAERFRAAPLSATTFGGLSGPSKCGVVWCGVGTLSQLSLSNNHRQC